MENTYSWTCENEIGTTIPQYANSQGITYEAARRQVVKYLDNELQGHIRVRNKTKYLDDYAIEFLNEHRRPQAQWSNPDTTEHLNAFMTEYMNAFRNYFVQIPKENLGSSSGEIVHSAPRSETAAKNQTAGETTQEPDVPLKTVPFIQWLSKEGHVNESSPVDSSVDSSVEPSPERQLTALKVENELLKKQLTDIQAAYNKLLVETSNLNAKIYYAEKNAENTEKNSKRWYNLALECIRTFDQQQSQNFNAAASDTTDRNPSED